LLFEGVDSMIRRFTVLAAVLVAACDSAQTDAANAPAGGNKSTAAPNAPSQIAGVAPGQQVRALRDGQCAEEGPGASDEPWNVKQGSVGNLVRIEGATSLIDTGSGLPCRIATDALGPG
jgi:hypothetical protein